MTGAEKTGAEENEMMGAVETTGAEATEVEVVTCVDMMIGPEGTIGLEGTTGGEVVVEMIVETTGMRSVRETLSAVQSVQNVRR
jgi:hypothetical protein